jgi:hypothetical protein
MGEGGSYLWRVIDATRLTLIVYYAVGILLIAPGIAIAFVEMLAPAAAIRWRRRLPEHRSLGPFPGVADAFDRLLGLDQPEVAKAHRNVRLVGVILLFSMLLFGYVWLALAP